ncbi:hypothetical protein ACQY0O_004370 [Thecaphora frezii]
MHVRDEPGFDLPKANGWAPCKTEMTSDEDSRWRCHEQPSCSTPLYASNQPPQQQQQQGGESKRPQPSEEPTRTLPSVLHLPFSNYLGLHSDLCPSPLSPTQQQGMASSHGVFTFFESERHARFSQASAHDHRRLLRLGGRGDGCEVSVEMRRGPPDSGLLAGGGGCGSALGVDGGLSSCLAPSPSSEYSFRSPSMEHGWETPLTTPLRTPNTAGSAWRAETSVAATTSYPYLCPPVFAYISDDEVPDAVHHARITEIEMASPSIASPSFAPSRQDSYASRPPTAAGICPTAPLATLQVPHSAVAMREAESAPKSCPLPNATEFRLKQEEALVCFSRWQPLSNASSGERGQAWSHIDVGSSPPALPHTHIPLHEYFYAEEGTAAPHFGFPAPFNGAERRPSEPAFGHAPQLPGKPMLGDTAAATEMDEAAMLSLSSSSKKLAIAGLGSRRCASTHHPRFVCPHRSCGKTFASLWNLHQHIKTHSPGRTKQHRCPLEVCNRSYFYLRDLKRHVNKVHPDLAPSLSLDLIAKVEAADETMPPPPPLSVPMPMSSPLPLTNWRGKKEPESTEYEESERAADGKKQGATAHTSVWAQGLPSVLQRPP